MIGELRGKMHTGVIRMNNQPVAEYKFMGLGKLTLYRNRIEIIGNHLPGFTFMAKRNIIPLSRVANVDFVKWKQPFIKIHTNDGKVFKPQLFLGQAEDLYQKIMELL